MKPNLGFRFSALGFFVAVVGCASNPPIRKSHTPYSEMPPAHPAIVVPAATPVVPPPQTRVAPEQIVKVAQGYYQNAKIEESRSLLWSVSEDQIPPNSRAEFWNLRGLIELNKRQPEQAQVSFQKALTQNRMPEYRGYYQYNYASALYESNRPSDAVDILHSIDVTQLDTAQQGKVINLKQKIQSKIPPTMTSQSPLSPAPGAPGLVAETPTETYSGPVNSNRIGLLIPLSGKYETFGKKMQRAVEMAFQHVGSSRSKNYEIIAIDSGDTPGTHLEALRKLVEEQQVIAVIGPMLSKGIEELAARAAYYQVPLVSIAQVQGPVASHLFSCSISNRDQARQVVEFAMRNRGFSRFAILAPSNKPGEEMANAFWDEVESRKGTINGFEYYNPEVTDFREPVDKLLGLHYLDTRSKELKELADKRKEMNITRKTMKTAQYFNLPPIADFDAVFIADDGRIAGQIIPTFNYRDAKNVVFLGMTTWNSNQFIQRTGEQSEGAIFPVAFDTLRPAKTSKEFYDLFLATHNTYPSEFDAISFDAAALILKVMDRSPGSRESFRSELESVRNVDSATGEISMEDHRCSRKLTLYTVKKGKFEAL